MSLLFAAALAVPALPPPGFVDVRQVVPAVRLEIRYANADNFTGAALPGYAVPGAWLRADAAAALGRVAVALLDGEQGLLVYDAYRPVRATLAMVDWAEANDRVDLLDDGYVARRSNHNRGTTVDLTIVELRSGTPLDMGTAWDTFSEKSHTENAAGEVLARRRRLRDVMVAESFTPYDREWWHFSFAPLAAAPPIDVPYAESR